MTIYELSASTGYTGVSPFLRRLVSNRSAIEDFKRDACEKYVSEIEKDMDYPSRYDMRVVVREKETDANYIFNTVKTTCIDYHFKDGALAVLDVQQSMK